MRGIQQKQQTHNRAHPSLTSRTDFFSEDNLFVILGVLEGVPNIDFDPNDSRARTHVFEVMHDRFRGGEPLASLNKQVIMDVIQKRDTSGGAVKEERRVQEAQASGGYGSPPSYGDDGKGADKQLSRNLDIHGGRQMPLALPDRPMQPTHRSDPAQVDLAAAFEAMQATRAPPQDERPPEIDFGQGAQQESVSAEEMLARFNALQKQHGEGIALLGEAGVVAEEEEGARGESESGVARRSADEHDEHGAHASFERAAHAQDSRIDLALSELAAQSEAQAAAFQSSQVYRSGEQDKMAMDGAFEVSSGKESMVLVDDGAGAMNGRMSGTLLHSSNALAAESSSTPLSGAVGATLRVLGQPADDEDGDGGEGAADDDKGDTEDKGGKGDTESGCHVPEEEEGGGSEGQPLMRALAPELSGSMRRMLSDAEVWRPDAPSRQADFHHALQQRPAYMQVNDTPLADIPFLNHNADTLLHNNGKMCTPHPARTYKAHTIFLEVSSGDRNRIVDGKETAAFFTVYFASQKTAVKRYPIFYSHPLEPTTDVRKCAGLRGAPDPAIVCDTGNDDLGDIMHYEDIDVPSGGMVGGANVDCVLKNVIQLVVKHVQLHIRLGELAVEHPYLILEIVDFDSVFNSTSSTLRKAFCKLFYDAEAGIHDRFMPLSGEQKVFEVPVASIDRLTFRLITPEGKPLVTNQTMPDMLLIRLLRIVQLDSLDNEVTGTADKYYVAIDLHGYARALSFAKGDMVSLRDIEWYNREAFCDWAQSPEASTLLDDQYLQETAYKEALCEAKSDEERIALRERYAASQIRFDYPTCYGKPMSMLREWLEECFHKIHAVKLSASDPNFIGTIYIPYWYVDDFATGVSNPNFLGLTPTDFGLFVNGNPAGGYPSPVNFETIGFNGTALLNGNVCNESTQVQISMTVTTRVDSTEEKEGLIPVNV